MLVQLFGRHVLHHVHSDHHAEMSALACSIICNTGVSSLLSDRALPPVSLAATAAAAPPMVRSVRGVLGIWYGDGCLSKVSSYRS